MPLLSNSQYNKQQFPLPKGYFGPTFLTSHEANECRGLVQACIQAVLQEEHDFVHVHQRQIDPSRWQPVKVDQKFRLFKRKRTAMKATRRQPPSMLGIGRVDGSLDDILYGWYSHSQQDLQQTTALMRGCTLDTAVLHTMDSATIDDPFHSIGLKWAAMKASAVSRLRDYCYVDAMGMARDSDGNRFGYIVMHSVDNVHNCPPFHPQIAIRAQIRFGFILREVHPQTEGEASQPNAVEVFSHGLFDAEGKDTEALRVSSLLTSEILSRVVNAAKCGRIKKLTLMATCRAKRRSTKMIHRLSHCCYLCEKKASIFVKLKTCQICTAPACSKCVVKREILSAADLTVRKATCCLMCIVQAKDMVVAPDEETSACDSLPSSQMDNSELFDQMNGATGAYYDSGSTETATTCNSSKHEIREDDSLCMGESVGGLVFAHPLVSAGCEGDCK